MVPSVVAWMRSASVRFAAVSAPPASASVSRFSIKSPASKGAAPVAVPGEDPVVQAELQLGERLVGGGQLG